MGQKVSPIAVRLGFTRGWDALWFARKGTFAKNLLEDMKIRTHVKKEFHQAAIAKVVIERASENLRVNVHTARPGVIIGRKGADIDRLRDQLMGLLGKEVQINIREIKNPTLQAQLLAEDIALQLERRVSFRRAMKKSIQQAMDAGAKGVKVRTKGRLGGSEIARTEGYLVGSVPLQTFRADIDYGFTEARTTYGKIGVKVWICRGDFIDRPNIFAPYEADGGKGGGSRGPRGRSGAPRAKAAPKSAVTPEAAKPQEPQKSAAGEDKPADKPAAEDAPSSVADAQEKTPPETPKNTGPADANKDQA